MSRRSIQPAPPEIIDNILSFLQSDISTLVICSQAHPSLSRIAERFLYADIVVSDDYKNHLRFTDSEDDRQIFVAAELHKLLTDSPHIANYIHKLQIYHTCVIQAARGVAPILPMLMRLDGISVTTLYGYYNWASLSEEFRDSFIRRLSSPLSIVKEVSILHFDHFPLCIFDGCKTVKRIGLHRDAIAQNNLHVLPHHALDSLSLRHWQRHSLNSEFMEWARKRIHCLQFLQFDTIESRSINEALPKLLRMCSTTLRSLELRLPCDGSRHPVRLEVDLSSVPHLKDLTIRLNIFYLGEHHHAFPTIVRILETAPRLNNLTLKFIWPDRPPVYNSVDWSPLLTFFSCSSDEFRHIELQFLHSGRFIPSIDTIPLLYDSPIVAALITKGILDICSKKWTMY